MGGGYAAGFAEVKSNHISINRHNMVSRVILSSFVFASLALVGRGGSKDSDTGYMQKLRDFSFDMGTMREYPANWNAMGTAIPIMSKVKLVPEIPHVSGQFF